VRATVAAEPFIIIETFASHLEIGKHGNRGLDGHNFLVDGWGVRTCDGWAYYNLDVLLYKEVEGFFIA
jgi:hypothetical protein